MREARSNSSKTAVTSSTGSDSRVTGIAAAVKQRRGEGPGGSEEGIFGFPPLYMIRLDKTQTMLQVCMAHAPEPAMTVP